jgi:Uma2 family endonuclease
MATLVKLGPADHDRPMTLEEFYAGDYEEGYQYELIDGKLYVSPQPNAPQGLADRWIYLKLQRYSDDHPEVLNFVYGKTRVFVPNRPGVTNPEPDVSAYRDFPLHREFQSIRWEETSPVLVVEVLSLDDPDKDLVRNVELYSLVPTIKEYWILDTREDVEHPRLLVYRRGRGRKWQTLSYGPRERYTTRLLPEFEILLDLRS